MEIKSTLVNRLGQTLPITYRDIESVSELGDRKVNGVHGFCFCDDKPVIVYSDKKGHWGPPGGGVEGDETVEQATEREILEETNMRVLKQKPIGYLEIYEPDKTLLHVRSVCLVEPIGPFVADADADGDVTEIKLIDLKNIKQYFDWGEIGDHVLARALELKKSL